MHTVFMLPKVDYVLITSLFVCKKVECDGRIIPEIYEEVIVGRKLFGDKWFSFLLCGMG